MDVELSWQTFACTGDILCYLDYRRQLAQQRLTAPAGEKTDGYHCVVLCQPVQPFDKRL